MMVVQREEGRLRADGVTELMQQGVQATDWTERRLGSASGDAIVDESRREYRARMMSKQLRICGILIKISE
jgi:hypothetical protein